MSIECKHFEICGLHTQREDRYCILHSPDANKDGDLFDKHFQNHIKNREYLCDKFVFPNELDFTTSNIEGQTFDNYVSFRGAKFIKRVNFSFCAFPEGVSFENVIFEEKTLFHGTLFVEKAKFSKAKFLGQTDFGESSFRCNADFLLAQFFQRVEFFSTNFENSAEFRDSIFFKGARFLETKFKGEEARFSFSSFLAPTYFSSGRNYQMIFENTNVYFEEMTIHPNDILSFRNADLSKAILRGTDCSNLDFSSVKWAKWKGRTAVYDEVSKYKDVPEKIIPSSIEELYRQLKQNYADKRDYIRAGDFHYGEKEALRKYKDTAWSIKILLHIYKYTSGYGERILPPFIWLFIIFIVSSMLYFLGGIKFSSDITYVVSEANNLSDFLLNSLEVMFFLGGKTYVSTSYLSSVTVVVQSVITPIILALLALSIRQKLKR